MKTPLYPLLLAIALGASLIFSCQNSRDFPYASGKMALTHEGQTYRLDAPGRINAFIREIAGLSGIEILEARLETAMDDSGEFFVIKAQYREGNGPATALFIPLEPANGLHKPGLQFMTAECVMECSPNPGCEQCEHLVAWRCRQQSCGCLAGTGGASGSVSF